MSATITVDQSRLVLNAFAAIFQNNLITSDLVTWHKHEKELSDLNRLQVSEQVVPRYVVTQTTNGVADLTSGVQGTVFGSETYTMNSTFNTNMGFGDFAAIRDLKDARQSEALRMAALNMAEKIDAYILRTATLATNEWTGTPGNNVGAWGDFATAYTRLKENGVDDGDIRAVMTYADKQALGNSILSYAAPDALVENAYRKGFTGEVDGIPTAFTQQLPTFTVGTRAASGATLINGAALNVNYSAVAVSTTPGNWLTSTINVDGLTGSQTVKDGEVFTIANVYKYDNRLGAATTTLQQFRVIGDYTASAGVINTMRVYPAIVVPGTGSGDDININTAHATVDSIPADNAPVTWVGTASTNYKPRIILQKSSINVLTQDLMTPYTDTMSRVNLSKVPLSVRMWKHSDFNTGAHSIRFDCALTANVAATGRSRSIRFNGA